MLKIIFNSKIRFNSMQGNDMVIALQKSHGWLREGNQKQVF